MPPVKSFDFYLTYRGPDLSIQRTKRFTRHASGNVAVESGLTMQDFLGGALVIAASDTREKGYMIIGGSAYWTRLVDQSMPSVTELLCWTNDEIRGELDGEDKGESRSDLPQDDGRVGLADLAVPDNNPEL